MCAGCLPIWPQIPSLPFPCSVILQTICQDPSPTELWLAAQVLGYVYNQVHCTPTSLLLLLKRAPHTVSPLHEFPFLISSDLTPTQSSGLSSNVPMLGKPSLILLVELFQCQELHLIVLVSYSSTHLAVIACLSDPIEKPVSREEPWVSQHHTGAVPGLLIGAH